MTGFDLISMDTVDSLQDFVDNLATRCTPLYESSHCVSDVEFGRQILNGVNPIIIKRVTEIPSKFPVTNDMVKPYLTRGKTLDKEIQVGTESYKYNYWGTMNRIITCMTYHRMVAFISAIWKSWMGYPHVRGMWLLHQYVSSMSTQKTSSCQLPSKD